MAYSISFDDDVLIVSDGLQKYECNLSEVSERLLNASEKDRNNFVFSPSGYGIHWPTLDEDLSINGLIEKAAKKY